MCLLKIDEDKQQTFVFCVTQECIEKINQSVISDVNWNTISKEVILFSLLSFFGYVMFLISLPVFSAIIRWKTNTVSKVDFVGTPNKFRMKVPAGNRTLNYWKID